MSVDITTLKSRLTTAIDDYLFGSTTTDNVVANSLSINLLNEPNVVTVANVSSLPNLELYDTPNAVVCFITDLGIFAISSNKKWITLDGRLLRDDTGAIVGLAYGWGNNVGDGLGSASSSPIRVVGFTDWTRVSTAPSGYNTALIRQNGTLWGWGCATAGALGDNSSVGNQVSPVSVVGGFTDWCQVGLGSSFGVGLRTNGTLWGWGCNNFGQLGNNCASNFSSPVSVVGGFTDWCQVSVGGAHTVAVRANGTLWGWGLNTAGQLGDCTSVSRSSPVSVVGGFTDWCQVSAGRNGISLAVRANGTAWAWGCSRGGAFGDNGLNGGTYTNMSSPVSVVGGFTDWCRVSAGSGHSLGLRTNGSLWAWGCNNAGQLGNGSTSNTCSPVSVIGGFSDWCGIAAGSSSHSLALRANGTLWAWGCGFAGVLGNNTSGNTNTSPVSVAGGFTSWSQISAGYRTSRGIVTR